MPAFRVAAWVVAAWMSVAVAQPPKDDPRVTDPEGTSIYDSLSLNIPPKRQAELQMPAHNKRVVAKGQRHALIVGVGQAEFRGIKQNPLPQCVFDAQAMGKVLRASGYQCVVLSDQDTTKPTVKNIEAEIWRIASVAKGDDQILVYISTHGGFVDGAPIVIASDGAVKVDAIKKELSGSKALVRILMLDCCRDNKGFSASASEYRDIHIISGCRPDEESKAGPNGLSVLTEAFVDALTDCRGDRVKDGNLELDEVLHYLDEEVPKRVAKYFPGETQNPTRTVVDPKAVNPILATCGLSLYRAGEQPTATAGVVRAVARNDVVLTTLLVTKLSAGMTPDEMVASMGKPPTEELRLDKDGNGATYYDDSPRAGDATQVVFEKGKLSRVFVFFKKMCKGSFNPAVSRAAVEKLLAGDPVATLADKLKGKGVKEIQEALGCASEALLAADGQGDGELHWTEVPRPSQTLQIKIEDGKASAVDILITMPGKP